MKSAVTASDVYYDPYDVDINADPYPVFRRLREEAPLYYNERLDFYAVSRYEDVERGLKDRETFISGRGGILELIKSGIQIPPGTVIFEDPPTQPTPSTEACCRACSPPARSPPSNPKSARIAPQRSTRSSASTVRPEPIRGSLASGRHSR